VEKVKEIEELKNQMMQLKDQVSFIKENESKFMSRINETNGSTMSQTDVTLTEEGNHFVMTQLSKRFLPKIQ
jgi:phosphopantetheine adenylyltransferase